MENKNKERRVAVIRKGRSIPIIIIIPIIKKKL